MGSINAYMRGIADTTSGGQCSAFKMSFDPWDRALLNNDPLLDHWGPEAEQNSMTSIMVFSGVQANRAVLKDLEPPQTDRLVIEYHLDIALGNSKVAGTAELSICVSGAGEYKITSWTDHRLATEPNTVTFGRLKYANYSR